MHVVRSWKSLLTRGRPWLAIPDSPSEFYDSIDDPMGDHDYDSHPLRQDIKEWLGQLPKGSWKVDYEYRGGGRASFQFPFLCWDRPIRFRKRKYVLMFKLAWHRR